MSLNREERIELRKEIVAKNLKIIDLAAKCNRTPSLISQYLKNKCSIDPKVEEMLISAIKESKGYEYVKVVLKREIV